MKRKEESKRMIAKYYVNVRPGYIEYFDDLTKAQEFANYASRLYSGDYKCEVKEC